MAWIRQQEKKHKCFLPPFAPYTNGAGDIWECDDCKQQWILFEHAGGGLDWTKYNTKETVQLKESE
jgi:hypothetical protein